MKSEPILADTDEQSLRCFPVMARWRPHRLYLRQRLDIAAHHFALTFS